MGRVSVKENKNIYHLRREELELTREQASELLITIRPERLERIESEKSPVQPDEVLRMSDVYKMPSLCNHYCSNECPIGQVYVPEIKMKPLSEIVLDMVNSINLLQDNQRRLIEISVDGKIDDNEVEDFVHIQNELERISMTVETLQLWAEKMIDEKAINMELYNKFKTCNK